MDKNNIYELKNKTSFYDVLLENTSGYIGEYAEIIKYSPDIYNLLNKLLTSNSLDKESRLLIVLAIAYFVLPNEVFPEEVFGAKGYIDDIYFCLYALKIIEEKYEIEELLTYWDGTCETLKYLLTDAYNELDKKFNHILNDILVYVGLK